MSSNENVFIHFLFDDECNEYAELIIEPSPDNLNRVYIVWAPCDSKLQASEQELSKLNRDGFTVLEWGGQEVPQISLEAN